MSRDPATVVRPDHPARSPQRDLRWLSPQSEGRAQAEVFIQRLFAHAYGARVTHFMPRLMALLDGAGRVASALGLRPAGQERLFLEANLDRPVEQVLGRAIERPVSPEQLATARSAPTTVWPTVRRCRHEWRAA